MGIPAKKIENDRMLNQGPNKRLFKINAGMGWCGKVERANKVSTVKVYPGDVIVRQARPLHAAPEGWPDLCGFESITITADMVGKKVAVFCAEEIKAGNDRLSPAQKRFKKLFESFGCIYRVVGG